METRRGGLWAAATGCTLAVALACGTAVNAAKKYELTVWDWHAPRIQVLKPKAAEYHKLFPNITIKISAISWGGFADKVLASVIGGTPPDIMEFHNSWTGRLYNVLAPYPPNLFPPGKMANEYYQFNTACQMKDGKFYFFPDGLMAPLIWYNKKLWSQAGLAAIPKTWDELRQAAKKLTQVDANGKITLGGFAFSLGLLFDDLNYQAGGGIYNDSHTGVAWYTDEGRKAVSLLSAMALSDGTKDWDNFSTGKTALLYNWTWLKGNLAKIPAAKLSWGAFPLPTYEGRATDIRSRNNYESGYAVLANVKSDRKQEAFKFLKWLYSDDSFYIKLNDALGRMPGKKTLWTRPEFIDDPVNSALASQIPYTIFPGERPAWIDDVLSRMETNILNKRYSAVEALKRAQDEGNRQWKIQPPVWIVEKRLPK